MTALIYIDTRGRSKPVRRLTPNGVRAAVHLNSGHIVEIEVNTDGSWYVHEGHEQRGGYKTVASGRA